MNNSEVRNVPHGGVARGTVNVPASKSFTHRALILAALAGGRSSVNNPLVSEDTVATRIILGRCGAHFSEQGADLAVEGLGGALRPSREPLHCKDSGTTLRLLMGLCGASPGVFVLDGSEQLRRRPVGPLARSMGELGVAVRFGGAEDCAPMEIEGRRWPGGTVEVDGTLSSQFLSGLLLGSVLAEGPLTLAARSLVSRPYAEMTVSLMQRVGVRVDEGSGDVWTVHPTTIPPFELAVEPDASSCSYFLAAAALTGGEVFIPGLQRDLLQGDTAILDLLGAFGAHVSVNESGATVQGVDIRGIRAHVASSPDLVPTLMAVALFADGPTRLTGVGHLRHKESDRLAVLMEAVKRLGGGGSIEEDAVTVIPSREGYRGAELDPHGDHRMAMAYAVMGIRIPGITVRNPACVAKSFPSFWDLWGSIFEEGD